MKATATVKVNAWRVMEEAVESGCRAGIRRFFKHRDPPKGFEGIEEQLADQIADSVVESLTEYFDFPGLIQE